MNKLLILASVALWLLGCAQNSPAEKTSKTAVNEQAVVPLDTCAFPVELLYHKESRFQNDSGNILVQMPNIRVDLDLKIKTPVSGRLDLGTYNDWHDKSNGMERSVEPGSVYEVSNARLQDLKCFWKGMCRRGFRDKDWDEWCALLKNDLKPSNATVRKTSGTSQSANSTTSVRPGFRVIENDDQRLVFTYGYSGDNTAKLQLTINYWKGGKWHHWHRDQILYPLPCNREMVLDLYEVGFNELPVQWEVEAQLIKSTGEKYLIYPFQLSVSPH